ncbi:hypothetical protein ACI6Q2_14450 [Chitinophagaceae bacterium LWZ2-11]
MEDFKHLLNELDEVLQKYNPDEYGKLQAPLPDDIINSKLQKAGINDDNVKAWFQWKNGEQEDTYAQIMECSGVLSLDDVEKYSNGNRFNPLLKPLFSEGDFMFLFNTNLGPHYGKLYFYSVACLYIDYPISYYDSMEDMVKTIIEAYRVGAYKYENDWLDVEESQFNNIAKSYNKNSVYWRSHNPLKWQEWYEI